MQPGRNPGTVAIRHRQSMNRQGFLPRSPFFHVLMESFDGKRMPTCWRHFSSAELLNLLFRRRMTALPGANLDGNKSSTKRCTTRSICQMFRFTQSVTEIRPWDLPKQRPVVASFSVCNGGGGRDEKKTHEFRSRLLFHEQIQVAHTHTKPRRLPFFEFVKIHQFGITSVRTLFTVPHVFRPHTSTCTWRFRNTIALPAPVSVGAAT